MHGAFIWNELATKDIKKAMAFYRDTFGWTYEPFHLPEGEYYLARAGRKIICGIGGLEVGALTVATESYWFGFLGVDDVDSRLNKAMRSGMTVLRAPVDVPHVGRVAAIRDPTGASIGWITPPK